MKYFTFFLLIASLMFAGCGKKETTPGNKKVAYSSSHSQIPVISEEIEDFFGDDTVSDFAFVDDGKDINDLLDDDSDTTFDLAYGDGKSEQNKAEDSFYDEDEDIYVSWEDEQDKGVIAKTTFKTVYYDLNKNDIKKEERVILNENIEKVKEVVKEGKKVVIQGHGCQLGSESFNIPLSERRAKVIKDEMVKKGVPADKIKVLGFGQQLPVCWSDKADKQELIKDLAPNRRAEIVIE